MTTEPVLRRAVDGDIPVLVTHRRRMFEDIAAFRGRPFDPARVDAMDQAYTAYLHEHLTDDTFWAWGVEAEPGGQFVASAAVSLIQWIPKPSFDMLVYLHSVYTDPAYRQRGFARRSVQASIDFCRQRGFKRLVLHASHMGQTLYESLGFVLTNEMALDL